MKTIDLHELKLKHFLSVGEEVVSIDISSGLHVITGCNLDKEDGKNGVGKSTIADAICFALFGTTIRPIPIDRISNWKTKKTGVVSLTFSITSNYKTVNYKVVRTINPSKVQLTENGVNISRTIGKTNTALRNLLSTTPEMFEQSVILCVNQTEPFMSKKKVNKRKFIEGIFKLDVFSEMLSIIRHEQKTLKTKLKYESAKLEELENTLQIHVQQQQDQIKNRESRLTELKLRQDRNTQEIQDLQDAIIKDIDERRDKCIQGVTELKAEITDHRKEMQKLNTEKLEALSHIHSLERRLEELAALDTDVCIMCKKPFTAGEKSQHASEKESINSQVTTYNETISTIEEEYKIRDGKSKKARESINELVNQIHALDLQDKENENIEQRIVQCRTWLAQLKVDIEEIETYKDTYTEIIEDTTTRLNAVKEKMAEYEKTQQIIETSRFVVSEEGVKSFIVKKMLKMLNTRLNYYLQRLDANCVCTFDEYFEETIINNSGVPCSYFNFSGGERKRVDLAMLFTFLDIRRAQSNVSFNFSMYDELLDSSLDSKGIECALEILQDRVREFNEGVYIISHRSDAIKHATGDVIYLEKQNDITTRKKYNELTI